MSYSPVIQDGKLARLSVSQLSRFDHTERGGCQRKWWYRYVGKLEDKPTEAQQVGTEGHKRLELYFRGVERTENGAEVEPPARIHQMSVLTPMELPALKVLPNPNVDVFPEVALDHLSLGGIPFQGSMDLLDTRTFTVFDYKFQSEPRRFKEPTVQMWGYLEEVRRRFAVAKDTLCFQFVGIGKKPPHRVKVSDFVKGPQEVADSWGKYEPMVQDMKQVALAVRAEDVPCNGESCFAFGKCPYFDVCNRSSHQQEEVLVSFMDKLNSLKSDIDSGAVSTLIAEPKPAVSLAHILPPDAPAEKTRAELQADENEVPDSSPTYAPKKVGRPKKEAVKPQEVTATFAYKVNLERALGPAHKYELVDIGLSVVDYSGVDPSEFAERVQKAVMAQAEAFVAAKKAASK